MLQQSLRNKQARCCYPLAGRSMVYPHIGFYFGQFRELSRPIMGTSVLAHSRQCPH